MRVSPCENVDNTQAETRKYSTKRLVSLEVKLVHTLQADINRIGDKTKDRKRTVTAAFGRSHDLSAIDNSKTQIQ